MGDELDEGTRRFFAQAADHPLLTAADERRLARRWRSEAHEPSRHELVRCNIRLVISIALRFRNRGLPLGDLVQDGIVGLERAARRFDPERGYRFSTYATWWIRQAIQRALDSTSSNQVIKTPGHVRERRAKLRAAQKAEPDTILEDHAAVLGITTQQAQRALDAAEIVTSLDRQTFDDGDETLLDSTADPFAPDPAELVPSGIEVRKAMNELTENQRRVIELRFGFIDGNSRSLAQIADELDLPQTVVRNSQRQALDKLRNLLPAA